MGTEKYGNRKYSVFIEEDRVQVIRTGFVPQRKLHLIPDEMVSAIENVTGCAVKKNTLLGDDALRTGKIICRPV